MFLDQRDLKFLSEIKSESAGVTKNRHQINIVLLFSVEFNTQPVLKILRKHFQFCTAPHL